MGTLSYSFSVAFKRAPAIESVLINICGLHDTRVLVLYWADGSADDGGDGCLSTELLEV